MTADRVYQYRPDLVREVNLLWREVYETLAQQVAEACPKPPTRILEVGCFSGGVGLALLKRFPSAVLTIALDIPELKASFQKDWQIHNMSGIDVVITPLDDLKLPDASFDLVFCRGGFFFLDNQGTFLHAVHRAVAPGGIAFLGGGYGAHTPDSVIAPSLSSSAVMSVSVTLPRLLTV